MGEKTTKADEIRAFARDRYVLPSRAAGKETLAINAGEVHRAMGLRSHVPHVVTALEAMKFREENDLQLIVKRGPGQSTTTTFVFKLK